jgi:hypothetical protein
LSTTGYAGWFCNLSVFKAKTDGDFEQAPKVSLDDAPSGYTITSLTGDKQTLVEGKIANGSVISLKGVKLGGDVAIGRGAQLRPIESLNLADKTLKFTVDILYDPVVNGPIDLSSGSIAGKDKSIKIKVGDSVAHLSDDELGKLNAERLITGSSKEVNGQFSGAFDTLAACQSALSIIEVIDPDFETDINFTVDCVQKPAAGVGLNAQAFNIVLKGTKPAAAAGGGGTAAPGGGGSGDDDKGLSGGAVAGIVIGVAVVVGLAVGLIVYFLMKRGQRVNQEKEGST